MRKLGIYTLLLMLLSSCVSRVEKKPVDYVDVFIGTSNSRWMLGPYAARPFGMVQLGPDNQGEAWMNGYEYSIAAVEGFSHIHAWTMAGLMMMPQTKDFTFANSKPDNAHRGAGAGYHSRIEKSTETGSPGYYSCYLYDEDVKAEISATNRCGYQRYTFPKKKGSRILMDLLFPSEYNHRIDEGMLRKVSDTEIEGYAKTYASWFNEYTLYFVIKFSKPFKSFNAWNNGHIAKDTTMVLGKNDIGAWVVYNTDTDEVITVKTGLSYVSINQARLNLSTETDKFGWDFDAVVADAHNEWNELLSRIKVEDNSETNKTKFYTNLYRAFNGKQTFSDVNGKYIDALEREQTAPEGSAMYGGDAFWNSFWNLNGLWSLVSPTITDNWITTQLEMFDKTGWTSKGGVGIEYSSIMVGSHEISQMVSAYTKGIRKDGEHIYEAIKKNVTHEAERIEGGGSAGNSGQMYYNWKGYFPQAHVAWDYNRTLDYAYDDWCVGQMAKALGKTDEYELFNNRSKNWKNVFHPQEKWVWFRDTTGKWVDKMDIFTGKSFCEGNSWQYSWYVPGDMEGLVEFIGKTEFCKRLEQGFEQSVEHKFAAHAFDRSEDKSYEYYINHGNQINMQAAHLFNYGGKPWLTQKYSRAILDSYYGHTPYHGWEGDEDEGQMGAWFVMSAMGLFEMNGGAQPEPYFDLTSPLLSKITIKLDNKYYTGNTFTITAKNNSTENIYIQKATLNGVQLTQPRIPFSEVVKGGELILEMGNKPNENAFEN